ncbi:MAG: CRISPR-associated primase-polymerase type B [Bacteroidetes bacterium]|nr:CRISPR-associated primase-polymerase type B [Bacteroidota bacterium]
MFQLGQNLTSVVPDALRKIQSSDLFNYIRQPAFNLREKIEQLHKVRSIDEKQYHRLKTQLPYFTCGIFHPPFRKTENFAFIENFAIDIDHLAEKDIQVNQLKSTIKNDPRVMMIFISPGGDGLKVILSLKEKITDHVKYTMFYKLFTKHFSDIYHLDQVIDKKTCDVTRATFLSYDSDIFYNPEPEKVDQDAYINFESAFSLEAAKEVITGIDKEAKEHPDPAQPAANPLSSDILAEIKSRLNPSIRIRQEKKIIVPEKLNILEQQIKEKANQYGVELIGSRPINYGKQMTFGVKELQGELNVFYGKKGYSVVKSSKSGCSEEVNEIAFRIVCEIVF